MSLELRSIFPEPNPPTTEIFLVYQTTQEFYDEVKCRENFDRHCQWYYTIAEKHQKEHKRMQNDLNILGFFLRILKSKNHQ
ncbi:MAG: hypothetical protein QNJ68_10140 [Microcoleaceae cyanobacterium MO_207.B10]|nr:hypothetical protein [Microcoleaceae cyanobacterium MO_207.B10]